MVASRSERQNLGSPTQQISLKIFQCKEGFRLVTAGEGQVRLASHWWAANHKRTRRIGSAENDGGNVGVVATPDPIGEKEEERIEGVSGTAGNESWAEASGLRSAKNRNIILKCRAWNVAYIVKFYFFHTSEVKEKNQNKAVKDKKQRLQLCRKISIYVNGKGA